MSSFPSREATETQSKKHYYHLNEGDGGIFKFPISHINESGNELTVNAIGTDSCFQCVGLFIPLGESKCFAAHMTAYYYPPPLENENLHWTTAPWIPIEADKKALKDKVKHRLEMMCSSNKVSQLLKSQAVVVCPRHRMNGQDTTGRSIIDAICEALQVEEKDVYRDGHGFVVDYEESAMPQVLGWEDGGQTTPEDFDQVLDPRGRPLKAEDVGGYEKCNEKTWRLTSCGEAWRWYST